MRFPESILTKELLDALEEAPERVMVQVLNGRLTIEEARWSFGVVFRGDPGADGFAVDEEATRHQRAAIRMAGAPPGGA